MRATSLQCGRTDARQSERDGEEKQDSAQKNTRTKAINLRKWSHCVICVTFTYPRAASYKGMNISYIKRILINKIKKHSVISWPGWGCHGDSSY